MPDNKFDKALDEITSKITKKRNPFTVTKLSDPKTLAKVDKFVSTGCLPLDTILGGGYPVRRITEIYGDNSTGKTLLATEAAIETQELGGLVVYADAEIAVGVERMIELGVNPDQLMYADVDTIDDVFELLDYSIEVKNKIYGEEEILTFIWDSVAAIATKDELEKKEQDGYEAKDYPRAAAAISAAMRVTPRKISKNNVCLILINQTRQKLGLMFGDGAVTYGGKAIGFYSTVRLELQTMKKIKSGSEIVGVNTKVTSVKNKLAPPFQKVDLPIYYQYGIDEPICTYEFLKDLGHIKVAGSWATLNINGEEFKFQRSKFREIFDENYEAISSLLQENKNVITSEDEDESE